MSCCLAAAAAAKSLQACLTLCGLRRQPTMLPRPWDSPGKNTGVACHFLLQCRKVKSESEVAQLCPTLSDPMDCSPPGSSVHGIFQARVLEWAAIAFSDTLSWRGWKMLNIQNFNIKWNTKLYSYFCYTKVKKIKLDTVRGTKWCEENLFRKKSERCLCMKLHLLFNCWKWGKGILGGGNKGLKRRNKALGEM